MIVNPETGKALNYALYKHRKRMRAGCGELRFHQNRKGVWRLEVYDSESDERRYLDLLDALLYMALLVRNLHALSLAAEFPHPHHAELEKFLGITLMDFSPDTVIAGFTSLVEQKII